MQLPPHDCPLCPRLAEFRHRNRQAFPRFFNDPVPPFGSIDASLLVVGLAPGLKGANATGRPFTGDYAGDILYGALLKAGLAKGVYEKRPDDSLELIGVRISNAVRCVPPENKPTPKEAATCNRFLRSELEAMQQVKVILSLGGISHGAILKTLGYKASYGKFGHAAEHTLQVGKREITLLDSYHTSRYNIQTRRLTAEMFDKIIERAKVLAKT